MNRIISCLNFFIKRVFKINSFSNYENFYLKLIRVCVWNNKCMRFLSFQYNAMIFFSNPRIKNELLFRCFQSLTSILLSYKEYRILNPIKCYRFFLLSSSFTISINITFLLKYSSWEFHLFTILYLLLSY